MQRQSGIHFYIEVQNFNAIVIEEERKTGGVTHAMHALDTLFSSIERYGRANCNDVVIEKITGARLHLYVVGADVASAYNSVAQLSTYARQIAHFICSEVWKYKSLSELELRVGAAFGDFYDFEFVAGDGVSELTTIGYAANFAAKLQGLTRTSHISISENVFDALSTRQRHAFRCVESDEIQKYDQARYYTAWLREIKPAAEVTDAELSEVKDYINKVALKDVNLSAVRKPLSFERLSRREVKKLDGIPVYADVRGFTAQFDADGTNLDEMASKTQSILETLYKTTTESGGIHVQFQGDRESALFHNVPSGGVDGALQQEHKCYKSAVIAAMRMVDRVRGLAVHVGVGQAFGTLYATKIGARGERDNILLGVPVIEADAMEDKCAGEDQIAVTRDVYVGLAMEDETLAKMFKRVGESYILTVGYEEYLMRVHDTEQRKNTALRSYNGAYGMVGWGL